MDQFPENIEIQKVPTVSVEVPDMSVEVPVVSTNPVKVKEQVFWIMVLRWQDKEARYVTAKVVLRFWDGFDPDEEVFEQND